MHHPLDTDHPDPALGVAGQQTRGRSDRQVTLVAAGGVSRTHDPLASVHDDPEDVPQPLTQDEAPRNAQSTHERGMLSEQHAMWLKATKTTAQQ
jgi:hypothetical protein